MGRRRQRKQDRRAARRNDVFETPLAFEFPPSNEDRFLSLLSDSLPDERPDAPTCVACTEFVEDDLASRGSCLHPGSGIVSPWVDTPACAFFTARRRAARAGRW